MIEKSRLEELSAALSEEERKKLLERISKRMEREDPDEAVPVELADPERDKIISYELKKAPWWVRFGVWLRTFFSGRSKTDVFVETKLRMLRSSIRAAGAGLAGFESRDLSVRFAHRLYDLYTQAGNLVPVCQALVSDKDVQSAAYTYLVESRYDKAKKNIGDFMDATEMEDTFAQSGDPEEIKKKLSLRMNDYIRTTPESLFSQLEEQAHFLLYLSKLVQYPFAELLRYFGYVRAQPPTTGYPPFTPAPVMLTLDLLERLYIALVLFLRSAPDYQYAEEPVTYYLLAKAGQRPESDYDKAALETQLSHLRGEIMALAKRAESFNAGVPLLDIIRYFRRDPYYNLMFSPPKLYLKSIYFSTLKSRIATELDQKLDAIKEQVIGRKIQEILKGQKLTEFTHYNDSPAFDFRKLGLPSFAHVRSLSLAYNFVVTQYKGSIQEAVQLVAATALANNRIAQNRLMQNVSGLEDLESKMTLFDRSLSADEDDGKQLARYRFNMATDIALQKSYRTFVAQKDREARDLAEKTREYLLGVKKVFDEIRTSTFDNTRSLLKTIHSYRGKNLTLGQILNSRSDGIGAFVTLLDQLLELEKGS